MTQPNKAFAYLSSIGTSGPDAGRAGATYVVFAPDDAFISGASTACQFHYLDSPERIHELLADIIRAELDDPSVVVVFSDSPGRY